MSKRILRCALCRCKWPRFWMVPLRVWNHYIRLEHRHWILCFDCWKQITTARDGRSFEARYGRPVGVPFWFPLEWETGEAMSEERWTRYWPQGYPSNEWDQRQCRTCKRWKHRSQFRSKTDKSSQCTGFAPDCRDCEEEQGIYY